jgi:hypothetical protein
MAEGFSNYKEKSVSEEIAYVIVDVNISSFFRIKVI